MYDTNLLILAALVAIFGLCALGLTLSVALSKPEPMTAPVQMPVQIAAPIDLRESHLVREGELFAFRRRAILAGYAVVCSAPVAGGYLVTVAKRG